MARPTLISSSDIGGGRRAAIVGGPFYAGVSTDPGTVPGGIGDPTAHAGSAAAPIYSFFSRRDMGLWGASVTSSAGGVAEMRAAVGAQDVVSFSTVGLAIISATSGFMSTGAAGKAIWIAQTSAASMSSAAVPTVPPGAGKNACLVWDDTGKQLWIYSTIGNVWRGIGPTSSGGNLWVTTSAA